MKQVLSYRFFIIVAICFFANSAFSQELSTLQKEKLAECMISNACFLIDQPYVAGTLETTGDEKLIFYTDKFDCVTFVEYVLAFSLFQLKSTQDMRTFEDIMTSVRYRNGIIDGYGSRLHYFTEWMLQQEKKGVLLNVTKEFSTSVPYYKKIDFISAHKSRYPKLKDRNTLVRIKKSESDINNQLWYYIPKSKVKTLIKSLKDGDIIAITTSIPGLDIIHTGFAIWVDNKVHLLHASETEKKVVISHKTLDQYLMGNAKQTGIMVVRSKE